MLIAAIKRIIYIFVILNCFGSLIKSEVCLQSHSLTKEWEFQQWMDDMEDNRFLIKWNLDLRKGIIKFRAEVKTKVWASFGLLDSNGNTDLVIVWIDKDGSASIKDCTLRNDSKLQLDESQDWDLLWAEHNRTHIAFEFSRKLISCDTNDIPITNISSEIVVYSYGENAVSSLDDFSDYNIKGKKQMQLILPNYESEDKLDPIYITMNITVPAVFSIYLCKIFKIENPLHIIEIDAFLSDKRLVHHMVLLYCQGHDPIKLDKYLDKESFECGKVALPEELKYCVKLSNTWSPGIRKMQSDSESAWIFGDKHIYYMLEIHYINKNLKKNLRVVDGFKMMPSSKKRKYALSELSVGSKPANGLIIPPGKTDYIVAGHCNTDCFLSKNTGPKFIKFISVFPHMHTAGKKHRIRHFRNGTELPWIYNNENFVSDSIIKYYFIEPVIVLPGDVITAECTFNSMDRNLTTIGGESSEFEMCVAFFTYYPRIEDISGFCFSTISEKTMKEITGLADIEGFGKSGDLQIKSPNSSETSLNKYLINKVDWNESLESKLRFSPQVSECFWANTETNKNETYVSYPNITNTFKQKISCSVN